MERRDLYEDDLTEERQPSPAERDNVAASQKMDPDESESSESRKDGDAPAADED